MNFVWRVQKWRVQFKGRLKTEFFALGCDNETEILENVSHEIDVDFFLYLRGNPDATEKDIVCGDISYEGEESDEGPDPKSNLTIQIHRDGPLSIVKNGDIYKVPFSIRGTFFPLDRKQKGNGEFVSLIVWNGDLVSGAPSSPTFELEVGSGTTQASVLNKEYVLEFNTISDDPESPTPEPIQCPPTEEDPEGFLSFFFVNKLFREIDSFVLTPYYWPYDPNDGLGPIYDSETGEQLRPFPE
jgi:hypothetical protein